jgi:predicted ATPase
VIIKSKTNSKFSASQQTPRSIASSLKMKQGKKIAVLREALVQAGLYSLDEQAAALNLSRSTAWTVLRGSHKASGLSAKIVKRMLASPQLPAEARIKLREYVDEKLAGSFGHRKQCTRRFKMRIAAE